MPTNHYLGHFSLTLRQLRRENGFTQEQMAHVLEIDRSTYTYYETGKTSPSIHMLNQISRILNVPLSVFLDSEAIPPQVADSGSQKPFAKEEIKKITELSSEERELIALYRISSAKQQKEILKVAQSSSKFSSKKES
ncbi:MAG: helix-turn-helix transcriptional regulator [Oscillospiraceae bacterium]|nr:Helix-turn-helix domain-containing protein [Ruminococcaceae bacterium BL-4]